MQRHADHEPAVVIQVLRKYVQALLDLRVRQTQWIVRRALGALALLGGAAREDAFARFYAQFAGDSLVIDKWFALQGMIPEEGTIERVRALTGITLEWEIKRIGAPAGRGPQSCREAAA